VSRRFFLVLAPLVYASPVYHEKVLVVKGISEKVLAFIKKPRVLVSKRYYNYSISVQVKIHFIAMAFFMPRCSVCANDAACVALPAPACTGPE
jgi:hypothetical protein